ncbi:PD-(D/E)XK motif protein [Streptomyces fenghuangensis]
MIRTTPDELAALFEVVENAQVASYGSSRRRLLPDHPLDVFVEVRFPERERVLVVASDERIEDRELVLANGLTCAVHDGNVEVVAQPATDGEVFCALLADLVDHLQSTEVGPAAAVARRITSWQRMLGRGLGGTLSHEARLGLFGELLVLRDLVAPACGANAAEAWKGPQGNTKDFVLESWGVEAKTVSGRATHARCQIHGESQLDEGELTHLFLVHQSLKNDPQGFGLPDIIDELRAHPALEAQLTTFENTLLEAGWVEAHRRQYEGECWALQTRRCYRVVEGFPRVTPGTLPEGVEGVSYSLDLGTCAPFRIDETEIRAVLGAGMTE